MPHTIEASLVIELYLSKIIFVVKNKKNKENRECKFEYPTFLFFWKRHWAKEILNLQHLSKSVKNGVLFVVKNYSQEQFQKQELKGLIGY